MVYEVIVDIAAGDVDRIFDYTAPFSVEIGTRVLVPFGRRQLEGFVIGTKEKSSYETKDIILKLDEFPAVPSELLSLMRYLVEYRNFRYIDCLRLFIPQAMRGGRVKAQTREYLSLKAGFDANAYLAALKKNATAKRDIILFLTEKEVEEARILRSIYAPSAVSALLKEGVLVRSETERLRKPYLGMSLRGQRVTLTAEQSEVVKRIEEGTEQNYLLHGVTGSGKTEIYLTLIESALAAEKTAIMLVPEISLTPQMLSVFRGRFGDKVSLLHSGLSDGERYDEWRRLRRGETKVALGARSAIFAPVENIGIIIIDEEHDGSYQSESNPRYRTEDVAKKRAELNGAKLVLGSATPSLGTYQNAAEGNYVLLKLKKRVKDRPMPDFNIVDMRRELREGNFSMFSRALLASLKKTIEENNQAMLFLNRRGYSSFIRCRACGYVPRCSHCEVSLTYHKDVDKLVCHYCGAVYNPISECPVCDNKELGEGRIGTERVEEELLKLFPNVKVLRMDNDTTAKKDAYLKILTAFSKGEAQILVGTQMIAKGHDFPDVTLVGILDADMALYFPDYRANERTFQLITQVAGRAGRELKAGEVVMQTYNPNHYVFRFAERYDYEGFYERERAVREATGFPPFTQIVRVLITSGSDQKGGDVTRAFLKKMRVLKAEYPTEFLRVQAMHAPVKRISDRYRYQVVMFLDCGADGLLKKIYLEADKLKERDVAAYIEINPQQMM